MYSYKISGLRFAVIATILKNNKGIEQKEFKGPHFTKETNANIARVEGHWGRVFEQAEVWAQKRIKELESQMSGVL